jgi:hypothetical protein
MRPLILIALATPLMLVACGGGDTPSPSVVMAPPSGTTVYVPPGSSAKICPVGTVC